MIWWNPYGNLWLNVGTGNAVKIEGGGPGPETKLCKLYLKGAAPVEIWSSPREVIEMLMRREKELCGER